MFTLTKVVSCQKFYGMGWDFNNCFAFIYISKLRPISLIWKIIQYCLEDGNHTLPIR